MMNATYSPEDNKLRLYSTSRLDADAYARVKANGFRWAPQQELFVAPMWTPEREDLLVDLAGEIGDEDTSLVDRAEERAERFEDYSESRARDAAAAHAGVKAIADGIPLGQPILVGHHSERHARKDAERIENGMRRAVKMWDTSKYWESRAKGAIRHAKYKELPSVRARRIKRLETDKRRSEATRDRSRNFIKAWGRLGIGKDGQPLSPENVRPHAIYIANQDGGYWSPDYLHRSGYQGPMSLWEAAGGNIHDENPDAAAIATPQEIQARAIENHETTIARAQRWIDHYENRLTYERAMLGEAGGTVTDRTTPEAGGAVKCWASPRGGWSYIVKVNKVSVSVFDNWGNGGANFKRIIPFDKLAGVMSAGDVQAARDAGRIKEDGTGQGFYLLQSREEFDQGNSEPVASGQPDQPKQGEQALSQDDVDAMQASLSVGVKAVVANQLFATPKGVAADLVKRACLRIGGTVLEPSAGTGRLLTAIQASAGEWLDSVVAVEINQELVSGLRGRFVNTTVHRADFLDCRPDTLGTFDSIVMNPPFERGADLKHIEHARKFLNPGGRLVSLCADGPRQREALAGRALDYETLPDGSFLAEGTNVRVAIVVIDAPSAAGSDQ